LTAVAISCSLRSGGRKHWEEGEEREWEGRVSHTSAQLNHIQDVRKKEDKKSYEPLYCKNPGRYCHMKHLFDKIN